MSLRVVAPEEPALEPCACCGKLTGWWYKLKDVALCRECAKTRKAADVPTKDAWFERWATR